VEESTATVQTVDLNDLWKNRVGQHEFKMRNQAYRAYEDAFLGRDSERKEQYVTWRPQMIDGINTGDAAAQKALVNLSRQFVNHHQASFARIPKVENVPYSPDAIDDAIRKTGIIQGVFHRSRIKAIQPLQAWRLSCRGDAVYGCEWGKSGYGPDQGNPFITVRHYDPADCYPDMILDDPGAMHDLLVVQEVRRDWAEKTFNVKVGGAEKSIKMFIYWTPDWRYVQVHDQLVQDPRYTFEHNLGFVPWRWIYNAQNTHMAQSDIIEIPKLQQLISDSMLLMMDGARKLIDKSYWGKGITGEVVPRPGEVVTFPNPQAEIHEFPVAEPPQMMAGIMQTLQSYAQAMAGVSPISLEGMASGSIVTGSAIRHQVEAIEARTETKRVSVEGGFAILGEYILRVLEKAFPDQEMTVRTERTGEISMKGSEVKQWYTCQASYGDFFGMGPTERSRMMLEMLGKTVGRKKAISVIFPEEDVPTMEKEIDDYQLAQASITGRSQAVAQAAATGGSESGAPGPGGLGVTSGMSGAPAPPIQQNPPPTPPGQAAASAAAGRGMVELGQLTSLLDVVRGRLHGAVWAVGEIAIVGRSLQPRVMVEKEEDEGVVNSAFQGKARVTVGTPGKDEPRVTL
jgi:hypothetical protein